MRWGRAPRRWRWRRWRWWAGGALVAVYAAVAVATHVLTGGIGRPLFDGFAPPVPYRWVKPPPELARDNLPPEPAERTVPLSEGGSEPANASTSDAQIIIALPRGALPSHPPDTAVRLRIVPRDAASLGPVASDLRVVANAYEVTVDYQPSQAPVTEVAASSSVAMTASTQSDTLLHSTDGQTWTVQPSRPFGATYGRLGTFMGSGYYLVAASPAAHATTTTAPSAEGGGSGPFVLVLLGAVTAGGIGWAVAATRRRRQARAAAAARRRKGKGKRR